MHLYLVRHGTAGSYGPVADFDRLLTPKGEAEAERLGRALHRLHTGSLAVRCSPAQRCRRTAEILAEELHVPVDLLANENALVLQEMWKQDSGLLLETIAASMSEMESRMDLLLVGHQPGLERLSRWLLTSKQKDSPSGTSHRSGLIWDPATCACFELDGLPPRRHALLRWMFPPSVECPSSNRAEPE